MLQQVSELFGSKIISLDSLAHMTSLVRAHSKDLVDSELFEKRLDLLHYLAD